MGAVRNSNTRASHGSLNQEEGHLDDADGHLQAPSRHGSLHRSSLSIDRSQNGQEKPWQRSLSFLRRGSSRRQRPPQPPPLPPQAPPPASLDKSAAFQAGAAATAEDGATAAAAAGDTGPGRRAGERVDSMRLRPDSIALGPSPPGSRCATPIRRSPSPRRSAAGFSDAVSDLVDIVKYETSRRGRARARLHGDEFLRAGESPLRGRSPSRRGRHSPEYRSSTWLGQRSRSPSPSPRPPAAGPSEYYGRSQLAQRSRSPSPAASAHSLPAQRRRLPPTPAKPSTLRLDARSMDAGINFPSVSQSPTLPGGARSPGSINFPKVNASPTRSLAKQPRQLPSPQLPNGYKPRLRRTHRRSDTDEDDWC